MMVMSQDFVEYIERAAALRMIRGRSINRAMAKEDRNAPVDYVC
jgi:hypothetical protein